MIRHIVFWKFKDEAQGHTKEENLAIMKEGLYALRGIIPEIRSMELGFDVLHSDMSYDAALVMEFDDLEGLKAFKEHPEHVKVSDYCRSVRLGRVSVDYEF